MISWLLALFLVVTPCETPKLHQYAQSKAVSLSTEFRHSDATELAAIGDEGWVSLGENIGRGSSVELIMRGWELSPPHAEILNGEWTHSSLGTYYANGLWYAAYLTELNPSLPRCVLILPHRWNPFHDVSVV